MAKLLHEDEYAVLLADAERWRTLCRHHDKSYGLVVCQSYTGDDGTTEYQPYELYELEETIDHLKGKTP